MKEIQTFIQSDQVTALSSQSQANYKYALQHFETFLINNGAGHLDPTQADLMLAFCEYLKDNKKSGTTIQQYVTIIKMLFKFHGTPISFTYRIPSRDKKKQQLKKINRWFDESDVRLCLDYQFPDTKDRAIKTRNILLVRIAAETGARIKEIANIMRKDFDAPNHTVFLKYSKTEPRPAFYSAETAEVVSQFFNRTSGLFGPLTDQLFPSTDQCKKIITGMLIDLGLKKNKDGRGPHTFRHYVATHLYYNGDMDLNDLAKVLGDKPETIRDEYLHPTPAMLRRRVMKAWGWTD